MVFFNQLPEESLAKLIFEAWIHTFLIGYSIFIKPTCDHNIFSGVFIFVCDGWLPFVCIKRKDGVQPEYACTHIKQKSICKILPHSEDLWVTSYAL